MSFFGPVRHIWSISAFLGEILLEEIGWMWDTTDNAWFRNDPRNFTYNPWDGQIYPIKKWHIHEIEIKNEKSTMMEHFLPQLVETIPWRKFLPKHPVSHGKKSPKFPLVAPWKQLQSSQDHPSNQLPRERLCASPGKIRGHWTKPTQRMHLYFREIPQIYHRFVWSLIPQLR